MDINKIKKRLDSDPELNAARKRLAELHIESQAAQQEHTESECRLHSSYLANRDDAKVIALIERRDIAGVDSLRDAALSCREKVDVYRRAILVQTQTVDKLHDDLSSIICRELRADHGKLTDAIIDAALKLREANHQEVKYRFGLEQAGVRVTLPCKAFLLGETEDDISSALNYYLREHRAA